MTDKSSVIFGNPIDAKTIRKAEKSKQKFIKKFGDDSKKDIHERDVAYLLKKQDAFKSAGKEGNRAT